MNHAEESAGLSGALADCAGRSPQRPALTLGEKTLTYAELDAAELQEQEQRTFRKHVGQFLTEGCDQQTAEMKAGMIIRIARMKVRSNATQG